MKLSKVIIENYRGFYGKNIIEFDVEKKDKKYKFDYCTK